MTEESPSGQDGASASPSNEPTKAPGPGGTPDKDALACPEGYNESDYFALVDFLGQIRNDRYGVKNGDYEYEWVDEDGIDHTDRKMFDPASPKDWYPGIIWDEDGNLKELLMPNMELYGEIDLSRCKNLTDIDLSGNYLTSIKLRLPYGSDDDVYEYSSDEGSYINFRATLRPDYEYIAFDVITIDGYYFTNWYETESGEDHQLSVRPNYTYTTNSANSQPKKALVSAAAETLPLYSPEPADELEQRVLAGEVVPLYDGKAIDKDWEGICVDINRDGMKEEIALEPYVTYQGELVHRFIINREEINTVLPYLENFDSLKLYLASIDGKNVQLVLSYVEKGEQQLVFYEIENADVDFTERYTSLETRLKANCTMDKFKFHDKLVDYVRDGHFLVAFDGDEMDLDGDGTLETVKRQNIFEPGRYEREVVLTVGKAELSTEPYYGYSDIHYVFDKDGKLMLEMYCFAESDSPDVPDLTSDYFYYIPAKDGQDEHFD